MHKDLKIGKNAEIGGQEVKKGGQRSNFEKQKKTYPSTFREVSCVKIWLGYLNSKYRLNTE